MDGSDTPPKAKNGGAAAREQAGIVIGTPKPRRRSLPATHQRRAPQSQPERELFARNLRQYRVAGALSQRELSQHTGVAQAHVSQIENAMHNVCIDTMVKLAQAVGVPLYKLFMP